MGRKIRKEEKNEEKGCEDLPGRTRYLPGRKRPPPREDKMTKKKRRD